MIECETGIVIDGDKYLVMGDLDGDEWVDIEISRLDRDGEWLRDSDIIDANMEQISEALHEQHRNNLDEAQEYLLQC